MTRILIGGTRSSANFVYSLPSFKKWGSLASNLLGDWQLNGIFSYFGSTPVDIFPGANTYGTAGNVNPRPNLVAGVPIYLMQPTQPQWLNPAAFSLPGVGQIGSLGKGAIRGKPISNVDFSIVKNWRFKERYGLQFRAEMFNAFNHTNFLASTTTCSLMANSTWPLQGNSTQPNFGRPTNGSFGTLGQRAGSSGNPVRIQVYLLIYFGFGRSENGGLNVLTQPSVLALANPVTKSRSRSMSFGVASFCSSFHSFLSRAPRDSIQLHYEKAEALRRSGNLSGAEAEYAAHPWRGLPQAGSSALGPSQLCCGGKRA